MDNNFSFGNTAGASQSTAKPKLAGNNIYPVKFDGCEIKDVDGVKEPGKVYKQLILKFSNDDGAFEHTIWEPRAEDFNRRESEFKNKEGKTEKIPQPSNVESMMLLFKHAIDTINPTVAKQIDSKEKNLGAANWDALRTLVAKILDAGKGTTTKIKLLKNGKTGEAVFPGFFTGLTRDGVAYVRNNFIGDKVAFSTYEIKKINDEATAKPNKVDEFSGFQAPENVSDSAGLEMDFDVTGI